MANINVSDALYARLVDAAKRQNQDVERFLSDLLILHDNALEDEQGASLTAYLEVERVLLDRLIESESRYQHLVDVLPDAVYIHQNEHIEFVNEPMQELLKADDKYQLIGQPIWRFIAPEYHAIVKTRIKYNETHHARARMLEEQFIDLHGNRFPVEVAAAYVPYNGKPASIVVVRDITARKAQEKAIVEREARYRALYEQTSDAVFLIGLDMRHFEINDRVCDMLGYSRDEIIGHHVHEFVVEDERDESTKRADSLKHRGTLPIYERRFRHKDGSIRYGELNVALVRDSEGNPHHYHSVVRDITDRKLAEQRLATSERRYRLLADLAIDGMLLHRDGIGVDVNAALCRITGYTREELVGENLVQKLVPPEWHATIRDNMIYDHTPPYEVEFSHKDGHRIPIELEAYHSHQDGVRVAAVRDLTVRKRIERELAEQAQLVEAQERVLALEQAKRELLQTLMDHVAHEFRTPLSVIQSSLYLMGRYAPENEKISHHQGKIAGQIDRITHLLDEIADLVRLDNVTRYDFVPVDLPPLIEPLLEGFRAMVSEKRLRWDLCFADDLPRVPINEDLSIALKHLLHNAVRYASEDTIIRVSVRVEEADWLTVCIQDSGKGMSAEQLQHIGERFYRVDAAHTTYGFGLGIPIAQRVIDLHGGVLAFDSAEGVGTTAIIKLRTNIN